MAGYSFTEGMHIELRGRELVVEENLPNGDLRVLDIAFDESHSEKKEDLIKALFAGELEFLGDSSTTQVQREQTRRFVEDFTMLDEENPRKIEAKRRLAYVKAVVDAKLDSYTKETVEPILQTVHQEINDKKKRPDWKTVIYGYLSGWQLSGRDNRSLLPAYDKQGNRDPKYVGKGSRKWKDKKYSDIEKAKAKDVKNTIQIEIEKLLKRGKRISVSELNDVVELAIVKDNETEDPENHLPFPSSRAVYDCVDRLSSYDKNRLLHGKNYADKKFKSNGPGAEYIRPLQREEFDDTPTDLLVVDTMTRLPLGRATETFGIDCYSGMPFGSHTGFDGPGYLPIARALLHGIQPKSYLKELFPIVEGDWPVFGVPQEIGVDNGSGYVSDDLTDACNQLGIVVDYCPVRDPDTKPFVESFFRRLNQKLLHKLDGTTFSNFLDKGDYDSSANAVISFDAYMEIKHLFLVDLLAREPNSSRHNTPIKLWELGVKNYPPAMPRCARDLRVLLGKIEVRVITNSGIAFECLAYNSEELKFLRHELGGEVVKFKYDPVDISVIYVYDPRKDIYITVPALDQTYAKGLSLWQHQVIKRYAREELNMDPEELAVRRKAKKKIQDIVDREWIQSGKSDTKRRLARYMGIRQPDYDSVLEVRSNQPPEPETQAILGPEAQPPPSVIPLMMTPNSDFQGASDFDENLVPDESPEGSQETFIASSESGTIEIAQGDGTDKNKRKTSKEDQKVDPHSAGSPQAVGPPANEDWDDDDVDTTGFNASFNLPKEETIESSTFHSASN